MGKAKNIIAKRRKNKESFKSSQWLKPLVLIWIFIQKNRMHNYIYERISHKIYHEQI